MAEIYESMSAIDAPGVRVSLDQDLHVMSLRHFDRSGVFSCTTQSLLVVPLPESLCATYGTLHTKTDTTILAWRSPTETLWLA